MPLITHDFGFRQRGSLYAGWYQYPRASTHDLSKRATTPWLIRTGIAEADPLAQEIDGGTLLQGSAEVHHVVRHHPTPLGGTRPPE